MRFRALILNVRSVFVFSLLALAITSGCLTSAAAAPSQKNIRGTVVALSAAELVVRSGDQSYKIHLDDKTPILGVIPASRESIRDGSYLGTANVPDGDAARALEVVVIPPELHSVDGNFPWDLPSGSTASTSLTMGKVSSPSSLTMGKASSVSMRAGLTLRLEYSGGAKTVRVPDNVPVVTVKPGSRALLAPGAHVFASTAFEDSKYRAVVVYVGEHGLVPPM